MLEIVVGFDDTAGAQDALAFAAQVARATGASLRLVSVSPSVHGEDEVPWLDDVNMIVEPIAGAAPADALRDAAERCDASLIVVGSTHRGAVGRVLPGSTGERLLHGAACAVAIAPRGYAERSGGISTVGVGYNASDEASDALAAACLLARRLGAALRVIHVYDATHVGRPALMTGPAWSTMRDDHEHNQRKELEQTTDALPRDLVVEPRFVVNRPAEELARQSEAVDVMLVGSRGHRPMAAVLPGGVAHVLLARAACPVIVVPRGVGAGLEPLFEAATAA